MRRCLAVLVIPVVAVACLFSVSVLQAKEKPMKISSPAFAENSKIPAVHTCDGQDKSPPLTIEGVPSNAKSLALIVDDPDAPGGTWVHWVLWNIDTGTREIAAGTMPKGARTGLNDFKKNGYGGPCPPSGSHRYFFKLYALDAVLDLPEKSKKTDVEKAMKTHIVGQAELIGRYR
jgi:Raf kinase inhibitor-like YbhB/YbcL family protein